MKILNRIANKMDVQHVSPGIWAAMGIQAIRSTGFSIAFTYLSLYLYQQRHIAMTLVGLILLISGIISGVFQVIGGILADRFGHRRMFIIFQSTEIMMFALLAVLIGMNAAVWLIFVTSAMVSIAGGMSGPSISAMVADAAHENRLNESYGLMAIGMNSGWAIGPLIGGFLQSHISYAWVFGIGAMIQSFSLIGAFYLPRSGARKTTELFSKNYMKLFFSDSTLLIFCVLCMLFFLEMANWGSTLSVFTVTRIGFSPEQYGLLLSISAIFIIVFQYPISRRITWLGSRKALFFGSLLYGIGFLSLSWVKSFIPAVGSIVVLVIGEMLFVPTAQSAIGKMSKPGDIGKNMGILGLCATIGNSCGPLMGGFLLDRFPSQPLYVWGPAALPAFLAAFGFLLWRGYRRTEVFNKK
jgi:predicted MFS family arabinose efflux permease